MKNTKNIVLLAAAIGLLTGCAGATHLGFDYGESYTKAFTTQTDLTRTSIAASEYKLSGTEAADIRLQVQEATTDAEGSGAAAGPQ